MSLTLALSVFVANLPDADIVLGLMSGAIGKFHRAASHSVAATLAVGIAGAALARWRVRGRALAWGLWAGGLYLSHLILDMLVRDPTSPFGIQLWWPISSVYVISPFTPFRRFDYAEPGQSLLTTVLSPGNFLTITRETLLLAPLVILFWLLARRRGASAGAP